MDCQECLMNSNLRLRRCDCIGSECSSCSSMLRPVNEKMNTSCVENYNYHQDDSKQTSAAAVIASSEVNQNDSHRRATRLRRRPISITISESSFARHHHFLLVILILLNSITPTQQQGGITFGGVLNLDRCYNAMQNSQTDQKISRSQYVTFIQELANNQFQSFRYDADTDTYGNFPTTDFNSFPEQIRQEFNKFACGGVNFICDEAYLYTDGTAPDDPVPDPQQEVYLYQVCEGVESAIEETLPKTEKPTTSPTAGSSPTDVVEETVSLNYQISVPSFITEGGFMNGDNEESEELKEALLTAVQMWAQNMANELSQDDVGGTRKLLKNEHGRVLTVTVDPDRIQFTSVTNAGKLSVFVLFYSVSVHSSYIIFMSICLVCNIEPAQLRDQCLDIEMAIPIELTGNHSLTPEEIEDTIQSKFDEALKDGSFYAGLPPEVLDYISGISPEQILKEALSPPPTAQATVVAPTPPQQEAINPQIPSAEASEPAPSPDGGKSGIAGIAAGISAGLVVIIAGFFAFRRRQAQKRNVDDADSAPSFGKRASDDSAPYIRGFFSAFAPKRKDIQSDDLEWGQEQSSDDSGSMQSYSSHSSSGSDSSSYYSTSGSSSGSGGPASVSASSASSYDTNPDDFARPNNNSMTSGKSSSSSEKDATQMYDLNASESSRSEASDGAKEDREILAPDYLHAKDRIDAEADDDSSAGSSGWESSDGDSSVQTGSVDSFDPNTESLATSVSQSRDGTTSTNSEDEMEDRELMPESLNPAVNPVVQPGVTMIPVNEDDDENDSTSASDDSDNLVQNKDDVAPMAQDLDRAIEAGDWKAVGATAAILASDSDRDDESAAFSTQSGSALSLATENTGDSGGEAARAAEIDELVETGNWDGVVAVAARYADDASTSIAKKPSARGDDEHHSDASVSVESARSFVTGTTRGSNRSSADDSRSMLSGDASNSFLSNAGSPKASSRSSPEDDMATHASSITSSYVSRSGISSSMVSNTSSMSNEKQQMNMYRAEVEALVRRVVPDEIDNIDDIMVQFSGREEELIETLKAMQEKSIAQRARAAVQRTAKREKGVLGRSSPDESDSASQEASIAIQTMSSEPSSSKSSNYSSAYTSSGAGDSITEDFAGMSRESSMYSGESSYLSREEGDSGHSSYSGEGSGNSDAPTMEDSYVTTGHTDDGTGASSLSGAVDASDWRAMGTPAEMLGEKSARSGKDVLGNLLRGGPSEADRASGRS